MNLFRRQTIVLLTAAFFAGGPVFAQEVPARNNVFGTLSFVGGTHLGARAALDFTNKSNWSVGLIYGFFTGYARDLPGDYSQYYISGPLGGPKTLKDVGQYGALTFGKNMVLGSNVAWHSRTGVTVSSIRLHENFRLVSSGFEPGLFSHGSSTLYAYDQVYHFPVGLYLGSALEFTTESFLVGTLGIVANINGVRNMVGLDLGLLIGKNKRKKTALSNGYEPAYEIPKRSLPAGR